MSFTPKTKIHGSSSSLTMISYYNNSIIIQQRVNNQCNIIVQKRRLSSTAINNNINIMIQQQRSRYYWMTIRIMTHQQHPIGTIMVDRIFSFVPTNRRTLHSTPLLSKNNINHQYLRLQQQYTKTTSLSKASTSFSTNASIQLNDHIQYILNDIPIGFMTEYDYILCTKVIRTLSSSFIQKKSSNYSNNNKHYSNTKNMISYNSAETSENILERIVLEILHLTEKKQRNNNINNILHIPNIEVTIKLLYNRCIKAWAFCYETNSNIITEEIILYKSYHILERMKLRYEQQQQEQSIFPSHHNVNNCYHPLPDDYSYSAVLLSCTNHYHLQESTILAEKIMNELLLLQEQNEQNLKNKSICNDINNTVIISPTTSMYNNMILLYANRSALHYGAASKAEDWLMNMSKVATTTNTSTTATDNNDDSSNNNNNSTTSIISPNTNSFNRVLKAWSISSEMNGADRSYEILKLMIQLSNSINNENTNNDVKPDHISFGTVINAYGRRNKPIYSENVFKHALEYFCNNNNNNDTSTSQNNNVKVKQDNDDSIDDDLFILNSDDKSDESNDNVVDLTYCLNGAISSWSKSDYKEAPEKIEALIHDAYIVSNSNNNTLPSIQLQPNTVSHTYCIEAYVNSNKSNSIQKADQYLQKWINEVYDNIKKYNNTNRRYNNHNEMFEVIPSTNAFNLIIRAYHTRIYDIFKTSSNDNNNTKRLMESWKIIESYANRSYDLLQIMIQLTEPPKNDNNSQHESQYHLSQQKRIQQPHQDEVNKLPKHIRKMFHCIPNTATFRYCIDMNCRIVKYYNDQQNQNQNISHMIHYVERSLELLDIAEQRQITDRICYVTIINAYCRCCDYIINNKKRMKRQQINKNESQNSNSSSSSSTIINRNTSGDESKNNIHDYDLSTLAQTAASVLSRYEHEVDNNRNIEWDERTTIGLYTAVITALSKAKTIECALVAYQLLQRMTMMEQDDEEHEGNGIKKSKPRRKRLQPTIRTYTAVIVSFASSHNKNQKQQPLRNETMVDTGKIIYRIYEKMKVSDLDPTNKLQFDKLAFSTILRALANANSTSDNTELANYSYNVLNHMLQLHFKGNVDVEPDTNCYDTFLESQLRTRDVSYIRRAIQIAKLIINKYKHQKDADDSTILTHLPSLSMFQTIIDACLDCNASDELLTEARDVQKMAMKLLSKDNDSGIVIKENKGEILYE